MDKTEKIIDEIVSGIDSSYTKNEKIRYVYLELGKRLSKDPDFFFSLYNKLEDKNLSVSQLKAIYDNEDLTKKVVCKSCSKALKMCFDRIGIESKIIETTKSDIIKDNTAEADIHHCFVCCKGDDDKSYFLILSSDLDNIQMGYRTKHFAKNISYILDGEVAYKGEEIHNSVMTYEEIEEIDKKLGYLNNYYLKKKNGKLISELDYTDHNIVLLRENYFKNRLYYSHLCENTKNKFYRTVQAIPCPDGKIIQLNNCSVDYIKTLDLSKWKNNIVTLINQKIMIELYNNIEKDDEENLYNLINDNKIDEWFDYITKVVKKLDISKLDISHNFDPISLVKRTKQLFNDIEKEDINTYSIRKTILNIAYQFVDPALVLPRGANTYATNYYISRKFESEMPKILELGVTTDFSRLGYSEQVDTIEKILSSVFQELNVDNCGNMKGYDEKLPGVKNRIITSAVKNRETGEYSFLFHITGDSDDDTYTYLYEPMFNSMSDVDLFSVAEDYIIVTSKLNPTIDDIENIEIIEKNSGGIKK